MSLSNLKSLALVLLNVLPLHYAGAQTKTGLQTFSANELLLDFDLLTSSLKEAHTGLYWYSPEKSFDSLVKAQRLKIKNNLNTLDFYRIVAPIVAFTKEDHCDIHLDPGTLNTIKTEGKFIPVVITYLSGKVFILNNPVSGTQLKGHELLSVNGQNITDIYNQIFSTFAADGYIKISKYRYLDIHSFAIEYVKAIGQSDVYTIETRDPVTQKITACNLPAISLATLLAFTEALYTDGVVKQVEAPASLAFEGSTAILSFNTFSNSDYEDHKTEFKTFVKSAFDSIFKSNTRNLIIDLRENGGGSEGNEDYLFSFLAPSPYNKYKYVQASALSFSFYDYTDYSGAEDRKELEEDLATEHYVSDDGRYLRKPGINTPEPLQPNRFRGNIYVLTGGWTYSGGAEFCSLMKEHTKATFIGEETGGGFYGNTSGYIIELTLPNTGLKIDIPLLKFVLEVSDKMPFGRGVIPDYEVSPSIKEFLSGKDVQMDFAKLLITKAKP